MGQSATTNLNNNNNMGVQTCGDPITLKAVLQETSELPNKDMLQSRAKVNGLLCSALLSRTLCRFLLICKVKKTM
jgi:hypothetical protein